MELINKKSKLDINLRNLDKDLLSSENNDLITIAKTVGEKR